MKREITAVLACLLVGAAAFAAESINVKDFGAKGDGKTDDTEAIRAAVKAAQARTRVPLHPQYGYFVTIGEVYFPSGHYLITNTIEFAYVKLRGENYAAIEQTNPEKDVFYNPDCWRQIIEGLTLLGGNVQLNLGNGNIDSGHVTVRDCHFKGSRGAAVQMRKGSNSTTFIIRDCVFINCRQAVITYTDWSAIRDCWITTDAKMDNMAAIEHRGAQMTIDNLCGVPHCTGVDQRWIDNYGSVLNCYGCRFGGEGGGFTPVVNFGSGNILIDGSCMYAQSNYKRKCAVYCEAMPGSIVIRSSHIDGIPPIKVDKKIDLNNCFRGREEPPIYTVTDCTGAFPKELPELLKNPVIAGGNKKIPDQLSAKETKVALAQAVATVQARKYAPSGPLVFTNWSDKSVHKEQTDPANYLDINPKDYTFDLTDLLDARRIPNSEYLAVAQAGDDIVIMRRAPTWHHVLIKNVKVDLDKFPFLAWKLRDAVTGTPNAHAVRIIDVEAEKMVIVCEVGHGTEYQAYNVKEKLGVAGVRTLAIRFYFLGHKYLGVQKDKPMHVEAKPGEYMTLDYIRFEAP